MNTKAQFDATLETEMRIRWRTDEVIALAALLLSCNLNLAHAANYCARAAGRGEAAPTPAVLAAEVGATFGISPSMAREAAMVRCVGTKLLACYIGANLNCGKADQRRSLAGASAYCRENPGSESIPMVATGHDTIYQWRCAGRRAVAGKAILAVDRQGYIVENWKATR